MSCFKYVLAILPYFDVINMDSNATCNMPVPSVITIRGYFLNIMIIQISLISFQYACVLIVSFQNNPASQARIKSNTMKLMSMKAFYTHPGILRAASKDHHGGYTV